MNFRSEKGVTLIALVVTVIVLLILAGISITTITDEDKGVVTKVKDAKRMAEENSDQEVADVKEIMGYVKKEDTSTGNINSGNTDNGSTSGDESEEDTLIDTSEPEEDILPEDDILESEETISGNLIPSAGASTKLSVLAGIDSNGNVTVASS